MADEQQSGPAEGFGEASDAPITETVGGKEYAFRILELDDLAAIARQAARKLADKALADLPLTAPAEQRDGVQRYYLDREPDVNGLSALTQELAGCRQFLRRGLCPAGGATKAALAAADPVVDRLVRERGWRGAANLAARVSGLFAPPKPAGKADARGDPVPRGDPAPNADPAE